MPQKIKMWKLENIFKNESFQKCKAERVKEQKWKSIKWNIWKKREKGQNNNNKDHSEYKRPALKPVFGFVSSGLL